VGLIVDRLGLFVERFAVGGSELDFSAIGIDAVGGAAREWADIAGVSGLGEEAEFQGGGTAVEDEDGIRGDVRSLWEDFPEAWMLMLSRMVTGSLRCWRSLVAQGFERVDFYGAANRDPAR